MKHSLSAAVIGTGFIGPVHIEALRRAGVNIAGVLGSSPEKSREAAERLNVPRGYANLEELLADRAVDVVHITTPNRFHFETASAALRAGKHVLCEKPLAMNSRESAELVRLAEELKLGAGVAYNIRFYPLCHEAAARFRRGDFGEVLHANGAYVQDWLLYDTDFNWRVAASEGGELRAVADIGTHWLDLIQFITDREIESVCADLHTVHPVRKKRRGSTETFTSGSEKPSNTDDMPIDTEDCGGILFRFAGGAPGQLWVSQTTAGRKNMLRFEIGAQRAALAWESESPNELWIGRREKPNERFIRDPSLMSEAARAVSHYPGGHNEGFPDTFKQLFLTFYRHLAIGDPAGPKPYPTFADGHREIVLCEAILKSARERRWVDVKEIVS